MRRKLVAGNWKMHGGLGANGALVRAIVAGIRGGARADYAVCVPFPYLAQVSALVAGSALALGAQSISEHDAGAYTGEVSGPMLREFGCRYVIVGHSERRALYGEDDNRVAAKCAAALRHGLTPVVCVGETLAEREAGATESIVARQLDAVLEVCGPVALARAVLAYEPVWAIGTGRTATPSQAQSVHEFLRERVAARDRNVARGLVILYGGSVKPSNAAELFAMADIDGGLIGGASLVADDFLAVCHAADKQ